MEKINLNKKAHTQTESDNSKDPKVAIAKQINSGIKPKLDIQAQKKSTPPPLPTIDKHVIERMRRASNSTIKPKVDIKEQKRSTPPPLLTVGKSVKERM